MTDQLTGRELDAEVARAMGWTVCNLTFELDGEFGVGYPPGGPKWATLFPYYSRADFSGLAPVVKWLEENVPTREVDCVEEEGVPGLRMGCNVGKWFAAYTVPHLYDEDRVILTAALCDSLPEACCRLLVSWAARRGST